MYGVTGAGNSVAAFVHGFEPYFYVEAPSASFSPDDCQALAAELNVRIAVVDVGMGRLLGGAVICYLLLLDRGGLARRRAPRRLAW